MISAGSQQSRAAMHDLERHDVKVGSPSATLADVGSRGLEMAKHKAFTVAAWVKNDHLMK